MKNIYKLLIKSVLLTFVAVLTLPVYAVTKSEMEQARTIAAKAYLRYANDGSGYLDDLNPKTMEELEAGLKQKEKENIKAFKAIPVPSDYSGWNKDKLVEYWAVTAFQNKGLLEKGKGGRIRARTLINKMTIGVPQPEEKTPASSTSAPSPAPADTSKNVNAELGAINAEANEVAAEEMEDSEINVDKAANYTWVYIMVLGILVAIVVALVVYAANVMKKNNSKVSSSTGYDETDHEDIEHYESLVNDKNTEISILKKKLDASAQQITDLKSKLEVALGELALLKAEKEKSESVNSRYAPSPVRESMRESQKPALRSIYLGRANTRGIFVRADRTLNVGNSVFVLETSDGFSGTFKVADSQAAWSLALSNPKEYLENACTGADLYDTTGVSEILTEVAGTAVFEGGCWRVIRKARIRYI